jgi:hypothetical protein
MRRSLLIAFILVGSLSLSAQKGASEFLTFHFIFGTEAFVLDTFSSNKDRKDSLSIHTVKFYVSGIEFYEDHKLVWKEKPRYYLVDAASKESMNLALSLPKKTKFTQMKFKLGVDSLTNVSGVMGGDLDPTKGMYWTWQSGYIHFKLEGHSSLCLNPKKEFQFHLGGYKEPFSTYEQVEVNSSSTDIYFDLKKISDQLDLHQLDHLMLPGKEAKRLADLLPACFSAKVL